jgi:formate hydrogenlyase subunit 6/NADH:ubiquinone oxidoreductase subunit I
MTMATDFLPQIDPLKCIGCELCVKLCPTDALGLIDGVASLTAAKRCTYSGVCQEICPTGAISLLYVIVFSSENARDA